MHSAVEAGRQDEKGTGSGRWAEKGESERLDATGRSRKVIRCQGLIHFQSGNGRGVGRSAFVPTYTSCVKMHH